ncbi:MAG: GcrA family cell cycle regulator [Xanthobacteraceae bacterium]
MTFTSDHVTIEWRAKLAAQGRERSIACGWSDERVELLKTLWAAGLSCAQIAGRLGGVSRNAVIGKVHRLGLSGRVTTERAPRVRSAQPRQPKAPRQRPTRPLLTDELYQPLAMEDIAAPDMRPCGLLELDSARCRFPVGDPGDADFYFCGGSPLPERPYCAFHWRLTHTPATAPQSRAVRSALTELWR